MLSDTIFYAPKQTTDIQNAVIMFHGYGSRGNDLISLAPYMAKTLSNTVFYAPNAPFEFESGYKWFDLDEYAAATIYEQFDYLQKLMNKAKTVLSTTAEFIKFVMQKHNLQSNQISLMGFSQGGLMALMSGILHRECLSGVIGCSAIPIAINNALSLNEIKSKPAILLTHGTADDIVPFIGVQVSQNTLKNIGCTVQTHIVPGMGHEIDDSCIDTMTKFIQRNQPKIKG